MPTLLKKLFINHPSTVNESYGEHFFFATSFAFWLAYAAFAALIHALVPALFETTAGRVINRLHDRVHKRG